MVTKKERRKKTPYNAFIAKNYHQLLPYAFKRFSLLKAFRTGVPTLQHYLTRTPLPESDKPALFTMNILPPMMTVWYHFVQKYVGDAVDIVIFDCAGMLKPTDFPKARVQKFLNLYAATKSQEFLEHIATQREIGWLCDDDMFFIGEGAVDVVQREMAIPHTASVSFRPRNWWEFEIDGKRHPVSSSYCIALNREIFIEKEHLQLGPADGNTHPGTGIGKNPKRYDTFDKANEILLQKGYRCAVVPEDEREKMVTGFSGMSGAVILLHYFAKADDIMDYLRTPEPTSWGGTMLPGMTASLIAICEIQDLYEKITGRRYPLPSLPSRAELLSLIDQRKTHINSLHALELVETTAEKLRTAL